MSYKYEGANTSGAFSWFFQRVTGLVLFVLTLVHFYIAHQTWESGHDWQHVVNRLASPYMKMFYLVFVLLGLWHGLNGLWSVIRDYDMSAGSRKLIISLIWIFGVFLGTLGFITVLTIQVPH